MLLRPITRPLVSALADPLRERGLPWDEGISAGGAVWLPTRLTSLRGWYRADLGITLSGADVDAWADQSGNGNHLGVAAAGNRPLYVASSSVFGNQACVEFDGVGEWMRRTTFDFGGAAGPLTIMCVTQTVTLTASEQFVSYGAGNRPMLRQAATNTFAFIGQGAATSTASNGSLTAGGAAKLVGGWWDLSNQAALVGTVEHSAMASSASAHTDDQVLALGASTTGTVPANQRLAEVVVLAAKITTAELASLYAYAQTRYGIS